MSYFELFEPSYFDIPLINNINKLSSHPNLFAFIWTSYLILLPFMFLYWLIFLPVATKRLENVSIFSFLISISVFILFYVLFCFISESGLSLTRRGGFQTIFESYILFYVFALMPLTFHTFLIAFSLKNLSIFKFLFRN